MGKKSQPKPNKFGRAKTRARSNIWLFSFFTPNCQYDIMTSQYEEAVIEKAWAERNPSWFLDYYFSNTDGGFNVYPGSVRHAQYVTQWNSLGKPEHFTVITGEIPFEVFVKFGDFSEYVRNTPGMHDTKVAFFEKRGIILLPWQLNFWRAPQDQKVVIGLAATGKTISIGLMAMFMCATIPGFRFLNIAPTVYQSNLMVREVRARTAGTRFEKQFLQAGRKGYRERPYAQYTFANGSIAEFMNVAKNADNIQSWRGDWLNLDEAGLLNGTDDVGGNELQSMLPGMITRLTGERPDGKPRLGWLSLISNAYDCDTLWEMYEMGLAPETKQYCYSALVLHKDNPYITPKQLDAVKRLIPPGMEASWLEGKRPAKKGAEFASNLIDGMFVEEQMNAALRNEANIEQNQRVGIYCYEEKPDRSRVYLMAGDPGLGEPPYRNAPCIQVWDVTKFPYERATLAAYWWGYANGSITPFLHKFSQYVSNYRVPLYYRGYDSTASQKHLAELAWQAGEEAVTPLGFDGAKKYEYLSAVKILLSKGLLQAPKGISGLERQLRDYRLPDKKLAQDTVSTLCMAAYLMFPLYREAYPDEEETDKTKTEDIIIAAAYSRDHRSGRRDSNRGGSLF